MTQSHLSSAFRSRGSVLLLASTLVVSACDEDAQGSPGTDAGIDSSVTLDPDAGADSGLEVDAGADPDAGTATQPYTIRFRAMVGSEVATCAGEYGGFGPSADQTGRFKDFRFYVHGIELLRGDGRAEPLVLDEVSPWQRAGVALLDFEDQTGGCANGTPELRTEVVGMATQGEYVGLRFVLGVPFEQNHQDRSTALAPLSLSALFWNWQGGYKFLRADMETVLANPDAGVPSTFNVHIGSTGCDGSPTTGGVTMCTNPNRPTIEFATFDVDANVVEIDYAAIVDDVDLTFNTPNTGVGCMSAPTDPECATVLPSLGIPFGSSAPAMDAFRVGMF